MILELLPTLISGVIGAVSGDPEPVKMIVENPVMVNGMAVGFIVDLIFRLIPQENHRSVLTVAIAITEGVLSGLKWFDQKISVKKKK